MKQKERIIKNVILIISLLIYSYLMFRGRNRFIYDMSYLKTIIFILLISLVIFFYGILKNDKKIYNTNKTLYIILYFIVLLSITFFIGRSKFKFYKWWYKSQLQPFYSIINEFKYGTTYSIVKNILGNFVMLLPLSFLLMIKDKKYYNIFKQAIVIISTTIGIEIIQSLTHTGDFDIDDILLNYIGTLLFTFLITRFNIMDKIKKMFDSDFGVKEKNKKILFYGAVIILIIYIISIFLMK